MLSSAAPSEGDGDISADGREDGESVGIAVVGVELGISVMFEVGAIGAAVGEAEVVLSLILNPIFGLC